MKPTLQVTTVGPKVPERGSQKAAPGFEKELLSRMGAAKGPTQAIAPMISGGSPGDDAPRAASEQGPRVLVTMPITLTPAAPGERVVVTMPIETLQGHTRQTSPAPQSPAPVVAGLEKAPSRGHELPVSTASRSPSPSQALPVNGTPTKSPVADQELPLVAAPLKSPTSLAHEAPVIAAPVKSATAHEIVAAPTKSVTISHEHPVSAAAPSPTPSHDDGLKAPVKATTHADLPVASPAVPPREPQTDAVTPAPRPVTLAQSALLPSPMTAAKHETEKPTTVSRATTNELAPRPAALPDLAPQPVTVASSQAQHRATPAPAPTPTHELAAKPTLRRPALDSSPAAVSDQAGAATKAPAPKLDELGTVGAPTSPAASLLHPRPMQVAAARVLERPAVTEHPEQGPTLPRVEVAPVGGQLPQTFIAPPRAEVTRPAAAAARVLAYPTAPQPTTVAEPGQPTSLPVASRSTAVRADAARGDSSRIFLPLAQPASSPTPASPSVRATHAPQPIETPVVTARQTPSASALQPRVTVAQEPTAAPARTGVERQSTPRLQNDAEVVLLAQRTLAPSPVRPAEFIDTRRADLKQESAPRPAKVAAAAAQAITLDTLAAHAKATHETLRVTAPTTSLKAASGTKHEARVERDAPVDEKRRLKDDAPTLPSPANAQPTPRVEAANESTPINAPAQVPAAFEPLLAQITDDPSLRISLMPNVARVSIDTGDSGRVSVQVKINDGVAEVRATGPGAPMLEQRQNELRVALAHEGLAMGNFDLTQGGGGRQERPEPTEREAWTPARPTLKSRDVVATDGHLHVKA